MSNALLLRGNVFGAADRVENEEEDPTDAPFCVNAAALGLIGRGGASFLLLFPPTSPSEPHHYPPSCRAAHSIIIFFFIPSAEVVYILGLIL